MDSRSKTRIVTPEQVTDIQRRIRHLFTLAGPLMSREYIENREEIHNNFLAVSYEILADVIQVHPEHFHSTEALENAVLQYAVLIGGETRTLHHGMRVDTQASFTHSFVDQTFFITYKQLTQSQVEEMANTFRGNYPEARIRVEAIRPTGARITFEMPFFYQAIIMGMLKNPGFQNLRAKQVFEKKQAELAFKYNPLWNPETLCAETNVDRLFNIPKFGIHLFAKTSSVEEREAMAIREKIKNGSNLHVYRILYENKDAFKTEENREKIHFALEKLKDLHPLYLSKPKSDEEVRKLRI